MDWDIAGMLYSDFGTVQLMVLWLYGTEEILAAPGVVFCKSNVDILLKLIGMDDKHYDTAENGTYTGDFYSMHCLFVLGRDKQDSQLEESISICLVCHMYYVHYFRFYSPQKFTLFWFFYVRCDGTFLFSME